MDPRLTGGDLRTCEENLLKDLKGLGYKGTHAKLTGPVWGEWGDDSRIKKPDLDPWIDADTKVGVWALLSKRSSRDVPLHLKLISSSFGNPEGTPVVGACAVITFHTRNPTDRAEEEVLTLGVYGDLKLVTPQWQFDKKLAVAENKSSRAVALLGFGPLGSDGLERLEATLRSLKVEKEGGGYTFSSSKLRRTSPGRLFVRSALSGSLEGFTDCLGVAQFLAPHVVKCRLLQLDHPLARAFARPEDCRPENAKAVQSCANPTRVDPFSGVF